MEKEKVILNKEYFKQKFLKKQKEKGGKGEMETGQRRFEEEYKLYLKSESFRELKKQSLENKKGMELEENLNEFRAGARLFGAWLSKTYGRKTKT